jgi:L-fucose isomerase-like protein
LSLTLLRLSLEPDGRLRVFVTEGQIGSRPAAANRTAALFVPQQTPAHVLIRRFVEEGFEHHVTAVHGHWAQAAGQLAFMLGAELVRV